MAEYLQVQFAYCHSGFRSPKDMSATYGISIRETRLTTSAIGVIKRHNPTSTWSLPPQPPFHPLFTVIAAHWGPPRAIDVMRLITAKHLSSPYQVTEAQSNSMPQSADTVKSPLRPSTALVIKVPRRRASLRRTPLLPASKAESSDEPECSSIDDPARKIWSQMRQGSSCGISKFSQLPLLSRYAANHHGHSSTSMRDSSPPKSHEEVRRRRKELLDTALRNKRSIGADSLKSLVPSMADLNLEGEGEQVPKDKDYAFKEHGNERRWSLGSWWRT
jgi:hypothetical protein